MKNGCKGGLITQEDDHMDPSCVSQSKLCMCKKWKQYFILNSLFLEYCPQLHNLLCVCSPSTDAQLIQI